MTVSVTFFADHPEFGDAARKIIVNLPGGGYGIAAPWIPARRPGDLPGCTVFSAPLYMVLREFGTLAEAKEDWQRQVGLLV